MITNVLQIVGNDNVDLYVPDAFFAFLRVWLNHLTAPPAKQRPFTSKIASIVHIS